MMSSLGKQTDDTLGKQYSPSNGFARRSILGAFLELTCTYYW